MKFKLKYIDGITKKICMLQASSQRRKFSKLLWSGKLNVKVKDTTLDFDIISFSGKRDLEEQALSIFSFVFYAGKPRQWTIYSDGSYSKKEKEFLQNQFHFLVFKEWNYNESFNKNNLLNSYLKTCHLAKKLHAIIGHNYQRQTMYVDSDVVFYKNVSAYFNMENLKKNFWYIPDVGSGSLKGEDMFALNSGFLILNNIFDFKFVFKYLETLNDNFGYFSEQDSFNYAFKKQNASVLDPRQFIIDLKDQFEFNPAFDPDEIALRHYVNPVRHKMWQMGWRWHFNI